MPSHAAGDARPAPPVDRAPGRLATAEEIAAASAWLDRWFSATRPRPPFSFTYGGADSARLLAAWGLERIVELLPGRQVRSLRWRDPAGGLEVNCEVVSYADHPAVDWLVSFRNAGTTDTAVLEKVHALDADLPAEGGRDPVVHHARGSNAAYRDFEPLATSIPAGGSLTLHSHGRGGDRGGLPSVESMPFFSVQAAPVGWLFALGWSAPWEARFARPDAARLALQAGTEPIRLRLRPGERCRTARVVLLLWQGDRARAHNLWRRLLLEWYSPRPGGRPFAGLTADGNWGSWMPAHRHLEQIAWWGDHDLPMECYWVDAGWTDMSRGWEAHQSHQTADAGLFPHGMRPLAEAAHRRGMEFLLWMVPASVHPAVGIGKQRPAWVGEPFTHPDYGSMVFYGLDHGDPEVNAWMIEHFSRVTADYGVDVFRQDGGNLWPADEGPDRQGMRAAKYVEGFYSFWDGLLERHPGLLLDNCAEGGRRLDIEAIRRSIVLWRSDCQASGDFDPVSNQGFSYGLFPWVPLCGGAAPMKDLSAYAFRSAYCPALLIAWPMGSVDSVPGRWSHIDLDLLRRLLREYLSVRPYLFGDFYPLTPYSLKLTQWVAWQFDRPDLGQGMVQAFRRPECGDGAQTYQLQGLDPDARYVLTDRDTALTEVCRGAQLMQEGARAAVPQAPGAVLLTYRREA